MSDVSLKITVVDEDKPKRKKTPKKKTVKKKKSFLGKLLSTEKKPVKKKAVRTKPVNKKGPKKKPAKKKAAGKRPIKKRIVKKQAQKKVQKKKPAKKAAKKSIKKKTVKKMPAKKSVKKKEKKAPENKPSLFGRLFYSSKEVAKKEAEEKKKEKERMKKEKEAAIKIKKAAENKELKQHKKVIAQLKKKKQASITRKAKIKKVKSKTNTWLHKQDYVKTGISGFDELFETGIPRGNTILIAGGAGSGKTIFCLQTMYEKAKKGNKCLYMSFEEPEDKLIQHMKDFKFKAEGLLEKGIMRIQRFNPFDISRSVDALLTKAKGELLIDIDPVLLPKGFHPDFVFLDSLTAIASAFTGKEESYRIYIEQLFRFFEKIGATTFLITETEQIPKIFSPTGVEEFLADGVVVLYNFKRGVNRESAIEVLKLRGAKHEKKIVSMQIIPEKGLEVYPEQEIFGTLTTEEKMPKK